MCELMSQCQEKQDQLISHKVFKDNCDHFPGVLLNFPIWWDKIQISSHLILDKLGKANISAKAYLLWL